MSAAAPPPIVLNYVRPFDLERLDGVLEIAARDLAAGRSQSVFTSLSSNQEAIVLARDELLLDMTNHARDPVRRQQDLFRWICFEIDFHSLLYNAATNIRDPATKDNNIMAILQGLSDSREETITNEGVPGRGRGVVELWVETIPEDAKPQNLAVQATGMITDYYARNLVPTQQINSEMAGVLHREQKWKESNK